MDNKRPAWAAAVGAALVGAAVAIGHFAGLAVDDITRGLRGADEIPLVHPEPPPRIPPVSSGGIGILTTTAEEGVSTFHELRKGTPTQQVVASAGCAVMNSGASDTQTQGDYETLITQYLPTDYQTGWSRSLADPYISRAANALWVANVNGGLGRWYIRYCLQL